MNVEYSNVTLENTKATSNGAERHGGFMIVKYSNVTLEIRTLLKCDAGERQSDKQQCRVWWRIHVRGEIERDAGEHQSYK